MKPATLSRLLLAWAGQLRFKYLFLLVAGLFLADLVLPDGIPVADELILGLATIILANWKQQRAEQRRGRVVEGEVVDRERPE